jgi:polyribonucleotide nucleotidyltransferase
MVERLSVTIGACDITFETGRIAKQAHGAVLASCGGTMVLSAVVAASEARPGQDFFPMTVDYREKAFAAGRIPGNFFRREARPSEREILIMRLTDRPLRPLFPKGYLNELQVYQNVYSADNVNDPDWLSINAASAALSISQVPFNGPIGAVRVGRINGELVVNPSIASMEESDLDIIMAGTRDALNMVEGSAYELPEDDMVEALEFGHGYIKQICDVIDELKNRVGKEKLPFEPAKEDEEIITAVNELGEARLREALSIRTKHDRREMIGSIKDEIKATLQERLGEEAYAEKAGTIGNALDALQKRLMRAQVIDTRTRLDGRGLDVVRPITIEVGVLPHAHGSCLFTRGETQAIVATTLGTSRDEQRSDELTGDVFNRFFLHYNFPAWSVGEVKRIMGPGRREIGHGKLAERALEHLLPFEDEEITFPYTIRTVSDITESNGSSSMATVCGGSLSLMDAGVPMKAAVAGIAMGLIKEGDEVRILTDILGDEDHLGDMDFKVCGTEKGITAFQMDVKIAGVNRDIMRDALDQARRGRLHVLEKMAEVLAEPRPDISPYAPRIYTIHIPVDKIREVIGPGGKVIREIQTQTGAEIEIQDDGTVNVAAVDSEAANLAIQMIKNITADIEVGTIYHGQVTRIMNFGAFVSLNGGKEGLVHISELSAGRVGEVTDVLDVGDEVDVKVIEIDKMGRVNLSKVAADRELGRLSPEEMEEHDRAQQRPRPERGGGDRGGDRGGRGGDRGGRDRGPRGGGGGGRDRGGRR